MGEFDQMANRAIKRCRALGAHSEEPDRLTRTFLSPPMRAVHAEVGGWMREAGLEVSVDHAGNIRGRAGAGPALLFGSHLDTVPGAGVYDGPLGVALGVAVAGMRRNSAVEAIGFSEEEGVRFGFPFLGSRALTGDISADLLRRTDARGVTVAQAIRDFGLDPARIAEARLSPETRGYMEFHIEQGPVLESLGLPLGVVESIVGQSRLEVRFTGHANHAGTTPMDLRRDALAGAAEWICAVEAEARATPQLVATVGRVEVSPGAGNVVPGRAALSLDVRHPSDAVRIGSVARLLACAAEIAGRRALRVESETRLDQPAVAMDAHLTDLLVEAGRKCGFPVHRMNSGAGHDAMVIAGRVPAAMLFLRSPGGVSHHPDESVLPEDVAAALAVGRAFLRDWEAAHV